MILSKYIKEILRNEQVCVYNERDVEALGLNNYGPAKAYCSFICQEKYLNEISDNVIEVITTKELAESVLQMGKGCIVVENPKNVFFKLHNYLAENNAYVGDFEKNTMGIGCKIAPSTIVDSIGVRIGNNVTLEENVVIKSNVEIADNVIIRAGTIVGAQDLEVKEWDGELYRVNHIGKVIIGYGTELGYNNVVGRAIYPWDSTIVQEQVQTSQNVVIGHGVKIGKKTIISSGTTICGRANIGTETWIGPNVVISNGLHIGEKSYISIGSNVIKDIEKGGKVFGNPARIMPM